MIFDHMDTLTNIRQPDNTSDGLSSLLQANRAWRMQPWPVPFNKTSHSLVRGDARDLSSISDESIDLIVTSPPYWTLKTYEKRSGQLGEIQDYELFLDELDHVWKEAARVLSPGGRVCCVVGDVCVPRKKEGRHYVLPLHADIQVRVRKFGLDCLTPILWYKIANGVTEAKGNGAGFYGKPYQPGAIVKNDIEYILFFRKGGKYRSPSAEKKALSMLTKEELRDWIKPIWSDLRGASTRNGHPAPYPVELAERLIKLFSFAGDTVLDPFLGTGSTAVAALRSGRNSIGIDIEPKYLAIARARLIEESRKPRLFGATTSEISGYGIPPSKQIPKLVRRKAVSAS